ncbi:MAG: fatty acid desaturase family protein [Nostocoides sp.]
MTIMAERRTTAAESTGSAAHAVAPHASLDPRLSNDGTATRPARKPFKASGRPNPAAHLTPERIEELGKELDALRAEVMDDRGARDAAYIRKTITVQRWLDLAGRAALLTSGVKVRGIRPGWWIGAAALSAAKIIENMEIGHNVLHGQWDWMRDPKVHSTTWEWDFVSPSDQWQHSHNQMHHTYTNVLGKDNDLGYGILRVDEDQKWTPYHLAQPIVHWLNAAFFEYGIAAYDLELRGTMVAWDFMTEEQKAEWRAAANDVVVKIRRQVVKDYVAWPALGLLTGAGLHVASGTFAANIVRNVWANTVIVCGHFPEGIATFEKSSIEGETRGEWYLRQLIGSANISGGFLTHFMSGNLSHQIEHHLYPDMPSNRYIEVAPRVRAIMDRYDLHYLTGPLPKQFASVYKRILKLSLPNPVEGQSRLTTIKQGFAKSRKTKRALKARKAAAARS